MRHRWKGRAGGAAHIMHAVFIYGACALVGALVGTPASAMQILEASDHGELRAQISATGVSRIALAGDRIVRVVRAPSGFEVGHDPVRGDLYLQPAGTGGAATPGLEAGPGTEAGLPPEPATLFIGTEKGFTYRLRLEAVARGSAQILIRNADIGSVAGHGAANGGAPRIAALTGLIRAVARREPLPGHAIVAGPAGGGAASGALRTVEVWRGPRLDALVLAVEAGGPADAAALAAALGSHIAAAWLAEPGTAPGGGRLGVAVRERAGVSR